MMLELAPTHLSAWGGRLPAVVGNRPVTIFSSPEPTRVWCYTPGILRLRGGRLIVTMDLGGPGVAGAAESSIVANTSRRGIGKILFSDDAGVTWREHADFPFWHARPFEHAGNIYIIGNAGDLYIQRSTDCGDTWEAPVPLTKGRKWHGSACNVLVKSGYVCIGYEERTDLTIEGWNVAGLTPRLMRAPVGSDLTNPRSWKFSLGPEFSKTFHKTWGDYFGVPFYPTQDRGPVTLDGGAQSSPIGWLEANIISFDDPDHIWHDPRRWSVHLLLRANTGGTGYAALVKVTEGNRGELITELETAPSGQRVLFLPLPGGHLKFHILFDDETGLFWLASSQSTDSGRRLGRCPPGRYNLPSNQRNRLQLSFSRNCIDWQFAGMIAIGETEFDTYNYPSMDIDGEDLVVVSRSGDRNARDGQYTNLITFHRIRRFRELVY